MTRPMVVLDGHHVVFQTDDKSKVFQVNKARNIFFEKTKLKGQDIIGQQYGTLFEVQHGKLVVATSSENGASGSSDVAKSGKDNRDLVDSGENQKLTQEEIMKMKEEGLSGQDIVEKLVEQSETFKTKTEFSQEKYIKKKKKKHMLVFRILHPSSRLLLDTFKHSPSKICNLRADSLSQLLCYSNVMSGSTVAVVESCHGLVLGTVMERMGGCGRVIHLFPGNDMNRHVVSEFNFPEDQMKTLLEFPLNKLASLEDGTLLSAEDPSDRTDAVVNTSEAGDAVPKVESSGDTTKQQDDKSAQPESTASAMEVDKDNDGEPAPDEKEDEEGDDPLDKITEAKVEGKEKSNTRQKRGKPRNNPAEQAAKRQLRAERLREAATILSDKNLDSLIIATKYDCVAILMRLLPYVAPSRPVVVFCQHKEPLVECFTKVKESGCGIQLKLSESWYREYQVLPSRTHPLMSMSGTGGYLLSFIRVMPQQ
ncbi:tRNA (adenine(58)-N(1))-methyltransferase non-catalytic subunit TRM6-like [Babylonia areolata]|uniref:tRNA (adenine(58)-N(1))-methyltransferase non-catalytic subunit TRM6-like n=1 Tax=Babylonia areolata TaxID=304850 RepID=UPI003FD2277C